VNQRGLLTLVENGLDDRPTVASLVKHRDDDLPVGHVDLEGAHVAVSQGNCGCHLRACVAFTFG
jgi:hypothetical protein